MRKSDVAVFAAAFLMGGTAYAEGKPAFKSVDSDGDGKVSVEEAKQAGIPKSEAKKEDLNNDGILSAKDWKYVEKDPKPAPGQGGGPSGGGGDGQPGGGVPGGGQGGGGQSGGGPEGSGPPGM